MRTWRRLLFWSCCGLSLLGTVLAVSACAATSARSTVGVPTRTPTVGPVTYSAQDFSIVYPSQWVAVPGQPPTGEQGTRVSIMIPDQGNGHEILQILETYPTPQDTLQSLCTGLGSPTTLAGLSMFYTTAVGGTVRQWTYVDSNKHTYRLWAFDLGQDSTAQDRQRDDQILAKCKVTDTTTGC